MKIEVSTNDFCPDNCPSFEIRTEVYKFADAPMVIRYCAHESLCKFAVEQYKEQESKLIHFCKNCGAKMEFCSNCGTKMVDEGEQ